MNYVKYFKHLFESIPVYRNIVWLMFLLMNNVDNLQECGFLKDDNNRLCLEFFIISIEQFEEELNYIKNEELSNIVRTLDKRELVLSGFSIQ